MQTHKTFVKQTTITRMGDVVISAYKMDLRPDGSVIEPIRPHRISIPLEVQVEDPPRKRGQPRPSEDKIKFKAIPTPKEEIQAVIDLNNADLVRMGYPVMDPGELDLPLKLRRWASKSPVETEVNSNGWIRVTVFRKMTDDYEHYVQFVVSPFDIFEEKAKEADAKLRADGFEGIRPDELDEAAELRAVALDHPSVKGSVVIQTAERAEKERLRKEAEQKKKEDDELARQARAKALEEQAKQEEARFKVAVAAAVTEILKSNKENEHGKETVEDGGGSRGSPSPVEQEVPGEVDGS